jgi:hypothetical protein
MDEGGAAACAARRTARTSVGMRKALALRVNSRGARGAYRTDDVSRVRID